MNIRVVGLGTQPLNCDALLVIRLMDGTSLEAMTSYLSLFLSLGDRSGGEQIQRSN